VWGKHVWISSSLRIIAKNRWITETRENLIGIWKEIAQKYGDWYLAEILVNETESDILIISWPRQLGQIYFFRKNTSCTIIWIASDQSIRYQRMLTRWKIGEDVSFKKFQEVEAMEEWGIQDVWKCLELCDIIIENNSSLAELEEKLISCIK